VVDNQHYHGTQYGDEQTVEIKSGHTGHAEGVEQPATDDRADHTETDVEKNAVSRLVDDLAPDEASDKT
jgi:hypothetical protein